MQCNKTNTTYKKTAAPVGHKSALNHRKRLDGAVTQQEHKTLQLHTQSCTVKETWREETTSREATPLLARPSVTKHRK